MAPIETAESLVEVVRSAIERASAEAGSTEARRPGHRTKFEWPPHPISYTFHVLASDWKGRSTFDAYGETFEVIVANTPYGVFGRCDAIWHEARGDTEEAMLQSLRQTAEPLFQRQVAIQKALGGSGRFLGHVRELPPGDLLQLLYCEDRDVANEARTEIETHASSHLFLPALVEVLCDRRHPNRRSAQWCVLDLFEDLPSFATNEAEEERALAAMKALIWDAEDDYARAIFKAGVVLGGHLPHKHGGPILLECLNAPSRIGRRSAIHGLFHVVEWIPEMREEVVRALRDHALREEEPLLRDFSMRMAHDIEAGDYDHIPEPLFPGE